jgi:hypothetical protein
METEDTVQTNEGLLGDSHLLFIFRNAPIQMVTLLTCQKPKANVLT